jgi:hypothetical protein
MLNSDRFRGPAARGVASRPSRRCARDASPLPPPCAAPWLHVEAAAAHGGSSLGEVWSVRPVVRHRCGIESRRSRRSRDLCGPAARARCSSGTRVPPAAGPLGYYTPTIISHHSKSRSPQYPRIRSRGNSCGKGCAQEGRVGGRGERCGALTWRGRPRALQRVHAAPCSGITRTSEVRFVQAGKRGRGQAWWWWHEVWRGPCATRIRIR